jgi:glycine cleavage system H protein
MPEYLETTFDKFIFRVATDRLYSREGLWASAEGGKVRIGLSDYLQQRSGDVAFAEVKPVGATLTVGDELATIETIKVNVVLPSPVTGKLVEINPSMATAPELVNQDPYGQGWVAVIEAAAWDKDQARLLGPQAYLEVIRREAEDEAKRP